MHRHTQTDVDDHFLNNRQTTVVYKNIVLLKKQIVVLKTRAA